MEGITVITTQWTPGHTQLWVGTRQRSSPDMKLNRVLVEAIAKALRQAEEFEQRQSYQTKQTTVGLGVVGE